MSAALTGDIVVADVPGLGRVLFLLPVVPDNAPAAVKEGLCRRRLATLEGRCPCGATSELPNRSARREAKAGVVLQLLVEHEPDCPASDERLAEFGYQS